MNISKGTITRTALLIIALINQLLTVTGLSPLPFQDEIVTELISILVTGLASGVAWWKNNSFTAEAIKADEVMKDLKGE